ncbi:MAG TPA: hypothetical protein DEB59_04800 [Acidimicrobiaceae bacterium]|nr:hypothetical protein [Acidimicrobiaceae bacterium]
MAVKITRYRIGFAGIALAFCASGQANDNATEKFLTDYERGRTSQGEQITTQNRKALWENVEAVGSRPDPEVYGYPDREVGRLDLPSGHAAQITAPLKSMFERLSENEAFLEFYDRVREQGIDRDDPNYGHEGDLGDLEFRGDDLAETLIPKQ